MTTRPEVVVARFELDCTDCPFRTIVVGEFSAVHGEIRAHQRAENAGPEAHFVNVHRIE